MKAEQHHEAAGIQLDCSFEVSQSVPSDQVAGTCRHPAESDGRGSLLEVVRPHYAVYGVLGIGCEEPCAANRRRSLETTGLSYARSCAMNGKIIVAN